MNKRIRYTRDSEGYISMRMLLSEDNKEYRAVLTSDQLAGAVIALDGTVYNVKGVNPHQTKIAIKRKLEQLNVVFERESRDGTLEKESNESSN